MADTQAHAARTPGLMTAFQNLTDGVYDLIRQHFELARREIRQEATDTGKRFAILGACAVIALVGYVLLNFAAVLFAGWFGGFAAMAITALVLAAAHLIAAAIATRQVVLRLRHGTLRLDNVNDEIHRDRQWLKQLRITNSTTPPPMLPSSTLPTLTSEA